MSTGGWELPAWSRCTVNRPSIQVIEQNLRAQENILTALTEVNAKYASTRRVVADLIAARGAQIEALTGSFNAYEDLLVKASVHVRNS